MLAVLVSTPSAPIIASLIGVFIVLVSSRFCLSASRACWRSAICCEIKLRIKQKPVIRDEAMPEWDETGYPCDELGAEFRVGLQQAKLMQRVPGVEQGAHFTN